VITRRDTSDDEAFDLYSRARFFVNQRTPTATGRAVELLMRATERDPGYALAWTALAEAYAASPINGDAYPADAAERAREATARAVQANPDLAEVQTAVATVNFWFTWDWRAAEIAARRAVDLGPNYPRGHLMLAVVLSHTGQFDEAAAEMQRAVEIDPLDPINHAIASEVAFRARKPPVALEHATRAVAVGPEFWIGYMTRAQAYQQSGNIEAALDDVNEAARFSNNNSKTLSLQGYIMAATTRQREARDTLAALESASQNRYVPPYAMALIHAGLGERDAAFEWLERAYAVRDVHLVFLTIDPKWDVLRSDPRFDAMVARCGFLAARWEGR
jgi:tetratricopeptide (TPR) repeat protein